MTTTAAPALLFITQNVPRDRSTGGETRQFHHVTELAKEFQVTVATYLRDGSEEAAAAQLRARGVEVAGVPFNHAVHGSDRFSPLLPARVAEAMAARRWGAVQVEKFWMAACVEALIAPGRGPRPDGTRFVLDEVDVEFVRESRRAELTPVADPRRAELLENARRVRERETQVLRWFDRVLAVSEGDAAQITPFAGEEKVRVVPLAVDMDLYETIALDSRRREPTDEPALIFVGNFAHNPNGDAILWFAREVWPRVVRDLHRATLLVVGANPPDAVRALATGPAGGDAVPADSRIVVTGAVPDVRPFLARARAAVAPLRFGAGVKSKVLEALAAGLPVVATPVGAEGLESLPPEVLRVAEEPAILAAECVALLRAPPDGATRRARLCRREVGARFALASVGERLRRVYRELGVVARPAGS